MRNERFQRSPNHDCDLGQLKVIQEVITMIIFAGFATWYMKKRLTSDYLYATFCLVAAAQS
ncbi:MAG: DMT family protein [Planctomycetota bacterium]|nr:DMT family protein [Planctomycetota bacterium]